MKPSNDRASGYTEAPEIGIDSQDTRPRTQSYPLSFLSGLASEVTHWTAEVPDTESEAVTGELWAFALSTFVDGTPITPVGIDDSAMFRPADQAVATDGGITYHDLTGFRRDLLQAISDVDGEPYGLALKEWLEDDRYSETINHSRLYQNLDWLVEKGLVTRKSLDKRTNAYRLTGSGRAVIRAQAEELAEAVDWPQLIADGGATPHASADTGETLHTDSSGGPITAHVHDLEAGSETKTVTVDAADLADAVNTHHHDDYPSVHLHTDGEQLFVTDHKSPFEGADEPHWEDFDGDVVREPVVYRPDDAVRSLVDRDALRAALDPFAVGDEVDVLVEDERPIYVTDGETSVGVAPQVPADETPAEGGE